ncbi:MAG TPA: branched-chain amino acid ABC transporter substrate-binding protein, partial [Burkholderiaceae bacterium]
MQTRTHLAASLLAAISLHAYAAEPKAVLIGFSGPLTGPQAAAGKDNQGGLQLAIERLNAQKLTIGGAPVMFTAMMEDDQGDPKAGVNAAQKLVDLKVKAVVGPYNSGVAIPASRVYDAAGIVMGTVASNPKVTQQGYRNVFRIAASDSQLGGTMARYAAKELKLKRVAIIDDRTAYGQGVAAEF